MRAQQAEAVLRLLDEIPAVFHRLRALAGNVHKDALTAGHRGILRSLNVEGARSVPQLARARPVSRQHIQMLVNDLMRHGLLSAEENPAHRKSPLLRLTAKGSRRLHAMQQREMRFLAQASFQMPADEIDRVTNGLLRLKKFLDSKEWTSNASSER